MNVFKPSAGRVKVKLFKLGDAVFGSALCKLLSKKQTTPEARTLSDFSDGRILVIRPGGIGDAVLLLPTLQALARALPNFKLDVLCEKRNAPVFELFESVDRILLFDAKPLRTLCHLRRAKYSCVIDTEQFHHFSAVFTALTRAPLRAGFSVNPSRLGVYTHLVSYQMDGPEDEQFYRLASSVFPAIHPLPSRFSILPVPTPSATLSPSLPDSFIAIHTGGSIPCKRWPPERYAQLCYAIYKQLSLPCVLVGGKEDAATARSVLKQLRELFENDGDSDVIARFSSYCGVLSLRETAVVCSQARLLVGPDSGLAHLSSALGSSVVVLFGPSDPAKWGPTPDCGAAVFQKLPCSPCSMFGYTKPCKKNYCMEVVSVSSVLSELRKHV